MGTYLKNQCSRTSFGDYLQTQVLSNMLGDGPSPFSRTCGSLDGKAYMFAVQGAAHHMTNATTVITTWLHRDISAVRGWFKECPESLLIVYTGATVCVEAVEKLFPHQNREKVRAYNDHIRNWLHATHPSVIFLDPYNITLNAVSDPVSPRTSDGFHFLSDVNVLQANVLLNLMHVFTVNRNLTVNSAANVSDMF